MGVVLDGLWMIFPWDVQQGRFSLDDTRFQTTPFFMLYFFY